jgi:hypothetical protein
MRVIRTVLLYGGLILLGGCIYEYNPEMEGSSGVLVINGRVTDREGYQYIEISRSSAPYDPDSEQLVSGYGIEIQDDEGNRFPGSEMEPGLYACWMDQEYLAPGRSYRLIVTGDRGRVYVSDFDELLACPDIDSITWEIQEQQTADPDINFRGVQFFVNTDCSGEYARHFRWELEETWEYHSTYPIYIYYVGYITHFDNISYDLFYCWETDSIPSIFTYSTRNLTSGLIRNYPLNFVSNQSDRFSVKYSLLVKQFSLGQEAYEFWHILDEQSKQSGELYETQPAQISGNIRPQDQGGETVLGLFYATSIKEKRIFLKPPVGYSSPDCEPYDTDDLKEFLKFLLAFNPSMQYPIYLLEVDMGDYRYVEQECFDCRLRGGTTEPPDFWE